LRVMAARITRSAAQAVSLATRLARCRGLDTVDDIAAIVENAASPVRDRSDRAAIRVGRDDTGRMRRIFRIAQRCCRARLVHWPGRRVRAVRTVECPREYTVLMVVDRQGAEVRRRRACRVLGRAWDARGGGRHRDADPDRHQ
jgi:hypothetical protein